MVVTVDGDKKLSGFTPAGITVLVGFVLIAVNMIVFAGNPAWHFSVALDFVARFQTFIVGILAFCGILAGFISTRRRDDRLRANTLRRDDRLRAKEVYALASALFGELAAAHVTCIAFLNQIRAALAKDYDKDWLEQEILSNNFGPKVGLLIFEGNADKLGILSEPLVEGEALSRELVVEIVVTFDLLSSFKRFAETQQIIKRGNLLEHWRQLAPHLEDLVPSLDETMKILDAYLKDGLPAATEVAQDIIPGKVARREEFGRKLGIRPAPTENGGAGS